MDFPKSELAARAFFLSFTGSRTSFSAGEASLMRSAASYSAATSLRGTLISAAKACDDGKSETARATHAIVEE
jgi:hypothetical protein